MREFVRAVVLVVWVLGLCAVAHYCALATLDWSSFTFGALGVAMVWVITWDGGS